MFTQKLIGFGFACVSFGIASGCESVDQTADVDFGPIEDLDTDTVSVELGVNVNAIDFMRNTSTRKRLLLDASQSMQSPGHECTPEVSYSEQLNVKVGDITHNVLRYVKSPDGRLWEQYNFNANQIWLERDTSWPAQDAGGNAGAGYDAKPFGSLLWAANGWTEGSKLDFSTRTVGFYWDQSLPNVCRYDAAPAPSYDMSGYKKFTYHPAKNWGGNLGAMDSIAVDYYLPTWVVDHEEKRLGERHWYARGQGWVGWEHFDRMTSNIEQRCVWNRDGGAATPPQIPCSGVLGDRPLSFRGKSQQMTYSYGDWDVCRYKATCREGQGIQGISRLTTGSGAQNKALCAQASGAYTGTFRAALLLPSDQRRATRSVGGNSDWDFGHWKLECGLDEYVAGVSQGAQVCNTNEGNFHGVLCAAGKSTALTQTCNTRTFKPSDDRATLSSGDWDPNVYKVECGPRQYVAGVSVNPSTYKVHSLLCCDRN